MDVLSTLREAYFDSFPIPGHHNKSQTSERFQDCLLNICSKRTIFYDEFSKENLADFTTHSNLIGVDSIMSHVTDLLFGMDQLKQANPDALHRVACLDLSPPSGRY